jgi:hypothetical protein
MKLFGKKVASGNFMQSVGWSFSIDTNRWAS